MKTKMLLGMLLLTNLWVIAQDKVLKRDGSLLTGKVLTISPTEVVVKQDSTTTITYPLTDIRYIKHQVGYLDGVGRSGLVHRSWSPRCELRAREFSLNRLTARIHPYRANYFHICVGNILFSQFSLAYERLFDGGKIGLKIPIKVGFRSIDDDFPTSTYSDEKVATSFGIDVNFYPGRQGFVRFFTGLGVRAGDYLYYQSKYEENSTNSGYVGQEYTARFKGLVMNNGLMIRPFTWLAVNAVLGVGVISIKDNSNSNNGNYSKAILFADPQLNLTIGL